MTGDDHIQNISNTHSSLSVTPYIGMCPYVDEDVLYCMVWQRNTQIKRQGASAETLELREGIQFKYRGG